MKSKSLEPINQSLSLPSDRVKRRSQDMRIPDAFNRDSEDLKKTK